MPFHNYCIYTGRLTPKCPSTTTAFIQEGTLQNVRPQLLHLYWREHSKMPVHNYCIYTGGNTPKCLSTTTAFILEGRLQNARPQLLHFSIEE